MAENTDKEMEISSISRVTVGALVAVGGVVFASLYRRTVVAAGIGAVAIGVSAVIINKIHTRKKMQRETELETLKLLETVLKEHSSYIEEIERCVMFIGRNVESLKKCDMSTLKWVKVSRLVQKAGDSVGAINPLSKSSGLIQGYGMGMDIYLIKDDSEQLKNGSETKFAKQIHMLAKKLQGNLDELMEFKKDVESVDM